MEYLISYCLSIVIRFIIRLKLQHSMSQSENPELQACKKAIQANPSYKTYITMSKSLLNHKQYHSAIQFSKKAMKYAPEKQYPHFLLGKAYTFVGEYKQAEKCLDKALLKNDKYSSIYYQYGYTLNRQERYVEGLKMFEIGIAKDPKNNSFAYLGRSQGFIEMGQNQDSKKNMAYAKRALTEIGDIEELTNSQKSILKSGIEKYDALMEKLDNSDNLTHNFKVEKQKQMINKIVQATQLNNQNVLENGYRIIRESLGEDGTVMIDRQSKSETCHCSCTIF